MTEENILCRSCIPCILYHDDGDDE